jgi:iron complex transport system substrate-binding protein
MPVSAARSFGCKGFAMIKLTGAALLALLAGCGEGASAPDAAPAAAAAPGFPRTLELPDGGALRLDAPAQRVVASASGLGDLLCELLPPERLAGLPEQMRDYSGHRDAGDPYLARPGFRVFAAEPVLALRPDLVVADRWSEAATRERLAAAGLPVLTIGRLEGLDDVRVTCRLLARALGEEARGEELLAALDARVAALAASPGARAGLRAVAYTNGGTGGWVAGAGTTADDWLALAGLANGVADREGHVRFSFEELLVLDPDVLVVPGPDDPNEQGGTAQLVTGDPALAGLRARRRGLIVPLPGWLFSTNSQHIVTAAEELARRLDAALAQAPP